MRHAGSSLIVLLCLAGSAFAQPSQVCIIRHGEELKTKPGQPKDIHLSLKGRERAAALVPFFLETPELNEFDTPVAIYAQKPKKDTSSIRAKETIQPLADALMLTINQKYHRDEYQKLADEVMGTAAYKGRMVLICWEHKVILDMAEAFGIEEGHDEFPDSNDRVWIITFKKGHKATLSDLPQRIMFGDSKK